MKLTYWCWLLWSVCYTPTLLAQQPSTLSLEDCYTMAEENYPLVKQLDLIKKSTQYSLSNAAKGSLPQLTIYGQATYQSDVTEIPFALPEADIEPISQDQYKIYGEVVQPITNLRTVQQNKQLIEANAEIDEQQVAVELYKVRERINQIYFGILLLDTQIEQTALLKKDIEIGIDNTQTAIDNGTALPTNLSLLEAEVLATEQKIIDLNATRQGYLDMLSLFIKQSLPADTQLEKPAPVTVTGNIQRKELQLYELQKRSLDIQDKMINTKNMPNLSLFFQGGYGRPALNLLSNEFEAYYIGGIRLQWNVANLYTKSKEQKILSLNQEIIETQRETFLLNTNITLQQQNSEIDKYQRLIRSDEEIITLREEIKQTSQKQLALGTITSNDYLSYVNAADKARQNLLLHETQLLMAQYQYQTTRGN
ncbi:MAG: TolC family protein [Bacteroidota bacterium]